MLNRHFNRDLTVNCPVLCIDTCSLLDVMRDPQREKATQEERSAVLGLLDAAENGKLVVLVSSTVVQEYSQYCDQIQEETEQSIVRLQKLVERVEGIDVLYGGRSGSGMHHLDEHHIRARSVAYRWENVAQRIELVAIVEERAAKRVDRGIAPASRSGVTNGDSLIFENYLYEIGELRSIGHKGRAVFLSSNTKDYVHYVGLTGDLHPDIRSAMKPHNLDYAPNFLTAAKTFEL